MSSRHVLVVIDQSTKVARTIPIGPRALIGALVVLFAFPILVGLGAKLSVRAEINELQTMRRTLEEENASYRSAIGSFTEQIRSLDQVIDELQLSGESARASGPSPAVLAALNRVKAAGGTAPARPAVVQAALTPSFASPIDALKVLHGALDVISSRLPSIAREIERREALAAATPSIWPVQGWLTDRFGGRSDPMTGQPDFHPGLDISTPVGNPVYATGDGIVEVAAYSGDFGNLVELRHNFGLSTRYAHLSRFAVVPGAAVKRGTVIGYVGATGRATGSHVHYEVLVNGQPIDPLQILTSAVRP